jgi:hypothetical protein
MKIYHDRLSTWWLAFGRVGLFTDSVTATVFKQGKNGPNTLVDSSTWKTRPPPVEAKLRLAAGWSVNWGKPRTVLVAEERLKVTSAESLSLADRANLLAKHAKRCQTARSSVLIMADSFGAILPMFRLTGRGWVNTQAIAVVGSVVMIRAMVLNSIRRLAMT